MTKEADQLPEDIAPLIRRMADSVGKQSEMIEAVRTELALMSYRIGLEMGKLRLDLEFANKRINQLQELQSYRGGDQGGPQEL